MKTYFDNNVNHEVTVGRNAVLPRKSNAIRNSERLPIRKAHAGDTCMCGHERRDHVLMGCVHRTCTCGGFSAPQ